ncbi:MAG: UDP-N-acetylmuramoyl-L-alanine--D-glutamate ligase [Thermoleophilaceae bacterium]|nr:UDP-N-acetylmuramoyl-L-alanine--D-glutamate ligase [Thermoleophilaceae bacterium]
MKPRPALPPGPYLVVGLARSGIAAAEMLTPYGEVIGADSGEPRGDTAGFEAHDHTDGLELLDRVQTVVKSPGVPKEAPVIAAAHERGLGVVGELELAWRLMPNEFVAVTGTNGKTTTVELLGEIHRAAGIPVLVAGNVGTALASLASLAGRADPAAVVVCECSSFQLEDTEHFAPECAVLLNVAEDHLDRHGTLEDYRAAKLRVFANQGPDDVAVVPGGFDPPGQGRVVGFDAGAWELRLRGAHNHENAMAATAAALARGVPAEAVQRGLAEFPGVEHRLEEVAERGGVLYVNDSKATNPASARVAVEAFAGGIHLILGGSLKGGSYEELRAPVRERAAGVYLIGEAAERLREEVGGEVVGDLASAVEAARVAAAPGDVVLLSPACASFDQYENFEARGRHFKELVLA